jgi:hypothetical protein
MRTDKDYGAQGGRCQPGPALPRGTERRRELHSDDDCDEYVKKEAHCVRQANACSRQRDRHLGTAQEGFHRQAAEVQPTAGQG